MKNERQAFDRRLSQFMTRKSVAGLLFAVVSGSVQYDGVERAAVQGDPDLEFIAVCFGLQYLSRLTVCSQFQCDRIRPNRSP